MQYRWRLTRILAFALETGNPQNMFGALEVGGAARSHDRGDLGKSASGAL
jgi:hypothetical protein